jgi:hypothetical protein
MSWIHDLQNTPTRSHEVSALVAVICHLDDAQQARDFAKVDAWVAESVTLDLAPLVAVAFFRYSTTARRKHPDQFPLWLGSLDVLRARLVGMGLDADHKLRGLMP